jgi:hypothetical protein
MQKEIELKCLCDGLLDAFTRDGAGKNTAFATITMRACGLSLRRTEKPGKSYMILCFTNEVVLGIQKQFQEGLVGNHISMHVRKMAAIDGGIFFKPLHRVA